MTIDFVNDFIPRRMREMGYGDEYLTRWRHFQVAKNSSFEIDAQNEYYYLINPPKNIDVSSKFGNYNKTDVSIVELQYEHRGKITITNSTSEQLFILFVQVIPLHTK